MIVRFLHWAASHGWVYDRIQSIFGAKTVYSEVAKRIRTGRNPVVLDIGAGTGTLLRYLTGDCRYICFDLEAPKLAAFRGKFPTGMALLGDASALPVSDQSVDFAVCTMVAHHLPREVFRQLLGECRRVLRPEGCFVFLDWLRPTTRIPSRILCALDRGAHPYSLDELDSLIQERFTVTSSGRFAVYHEYVVMVLRPRLEPAPVTSSRQTAERYSG